MAYVYPKYVVYHVYNKDTVGYSCEQKWFNLFVDCTLLSALYFTLISYFMDSWCV
jgi:hypothetical protein